MDEVLRYVSLLTLVGTAISFVIGLFQWIDQRNREQKQKEYEAFHRMVCLASGVGESGESIRMVQQIAAIYQLRAYKQYAFASVPVLELMQFEWGQIHDKDVRSDHMEKAVSETISALSKYASRQ